MRRFEELTRRGQTFRLRSLAADTLAEHYGTPNAQLRFVSMHSFNTIFRVDTTDGCFALRIGDECRIHPPGVEDTEAFWLDRLNADGFENAAIVPTSAGANWISAAASGVPGTRVCTLFTWVSGSELSTRLTAESARAAGRLLAELHEHAARLETPRQVDGNSRCLPARRLAELELRHAVYFGPGDLVANHQSEHGALFRDATERVQQLTDSLWSQNKPPHLLHGDFGPHNLLSWRSRLRPIDFQDLRVGFAIQDLGISITDLHRRAPELVVPFTTGYSEVRALPELHPTTVDTLAAWRSLNIMNLALHSPSSGIGQAFDRHANHIVNWMTN